MTPAAKRWTLWIALAIATGFAALKVGVPDRLRPVPGRPEVQANAGRGDASGVHDLLAGLARSRLSGSVVGEPFASGNWAPAAVPEKSKKPADPPPFGYVYAGRFENASGAQIYLMRGNELVAIKRGDQLDGGYEVVGVEGDRLDLTWLPGKREVSIMLSSLVGSTATGPQIASVQTSSLPQPALQRSSAPGSGAAPSSGAMEAGSGGVLFGASPSAVSAAAPSATNVDQSGPALSATISSASGPASPGVLGGGAKPSGILGTPSAGTGTTIGSAPQSTGMPMLAAPLSPMPMLPAPSGKLGN